MNVKIKGNCFFYLLIFVAYIIIYIKSKIFADLKCVYFTINWVKGKEKQTTNWDLPLLQYYLLSTIVVTIEMFYYIFSKTQHLFEIFQKE